MILQFWEVVTGHVGQYFQANIWEKSGIFQCQCLEQSIILKYILLLMSELLIEDTLMIYSPCSNEDKIEIKTDVIDIIIIGLNCDYFCCAAEFAALRFLCRFKR